MQESNFGFLGILLKQLNWKPDSNLLFLISYLLLVILTHLSKCPSQMDPKNSLVSRSLMNQQQSKVIRPYLICSSEPFQKGQRKSRQWSRKLTTPRKVLRPLISGLKTYRTFTDPNPLRQFTIGKHFIKSEENLGTLLRHFWYFTCTAFNETRRVSSLMITVIADS